MPTRQKKTPAARPEMARAMPDAGEEHLQRVRRICFSLPGTTEKLSHGEPTFFVRKRVFTMFANNHHHDGHIAVWLPAAPGVQATLIEAWPKTFFHPPYVGVKGWVGVALDQISDEDLAGHIVEAWKRIAPKSLQDGMGLPNENPKGAGRRRTS